MPLPSYLRKPRESDSSPQRGILQERVGALHGGPLAGSSSLRTAKRSADPGRAPRKHQRGCSPAAHPPGRFPTVQPLPAAPHRETMPNQPVLPALRREDHCHPWGEAEAITPGGETIGQPGFQPLPIAGGGSQRFQDGGVQQGIHAPFCTGTQGPSDRANSEKIDSKTPLSDQRRQRLERVVWGP